MKNKSFIPDLLSLVKELRSFTQDCITEFLSTTVLYDIEELTDMEKTTINAVRLIMEEFIVDLTINIETVDHFGKGLER